MEAESKEAAVACWEGGSAGKAPGEEAAAAGAPLRATCVPSRTMPSPLLWGAPFPESKPQTLLARSWKNIVPIVYV